jgi:menaquinone-dependent protoporphyrinogen oxidase
VLLGKLQPDLADFAAEHAEALNRMPTLLLQVSLAAAGNEASERADLDRIAGEFCAASGWTPGAVHQIAGAFRFTQYDFFRSWAMRYIAAQKGQTVEPGADREYTDWAALSALLRGWAESLSKSR